MTVIFDFFSSNKTWGTHTWQMTSEDCCWESSKFWYSNRNRNLKTKADWIDYWNHIHHCHWSNLRQFHRLDCEFWAAKIQFHPEIEKKQFLIFFFVKSISRIFSRKWFIFFHILVYLLHIFFDDHNHNNQPYVNDVNLLLEVSNSQPYL